MQRLNAIGLARLVIGCWFVLGALCGRGAAAESAVQFNGAGLPVLSQQTGGPFAVQSVTLADGEGRRQVLRAEPERVTLVEGGEELIAEYGWGKVACRYEPADDGQRLDIRIRVTNTSPRTIHELRLVAAKLRLDAQAIGRASHHNLGAPTVIALQTDERSVAVCNLDIEKPLTVGVGKPREGITEVWVQAGGDAMPYDDLYVARPIPPGKSDTYELSIRTGPGETDPLELAADIFRRFAAAHPPVLDWPDRRPITRLFIGGGAPREEIVAHYRNPEKNPRPRGGDEAYRQRVLETFRRGVAAAKAADAQGIIIWDSEGNSFPHPTTYVGDPRLVGVFNPDFDAVADEAFKMIADAGLLSGVCIRPTQMVYDEKKDTVRHAYTPVLENFPDEPVVCQLASKIEYARRRWGCRIFYVDTNFVWRPRGPQQEWSAGMIQARVWRKLLERFPDVLIVPEFGYPEYYACVAVYAEYDMGYRGVAPAVRRIYPDAFCVAVIEDADPYENYDLMVRNVREGDCLMTFATGESRNLRAMRHIDAEAKVLDEGEPAGLSRMTQRRLASLLQTGGLGEQFYAARALGQRGGKAALEALRQAAADVEKEWIVRKEAILALGKQQDAAAVEILVPLLAISNPDLRQFAAEALGRIGRPALKPVIERLDEDSYYVIAAGMIGDPAAVDQLIERLDGKARVRGQQRAILKALGMIGGAKAVAKLSEILNTGDGYVRVAAAEALGQIGTAEAAEALRAARDAEAAKPEGEQWGHLIWSINRVLNHIGD